MTDDEEPTEGDALQLTADEMESRLDESSEALEAAETEADLDDVEATVDAVAEALEAAEFSEPDDEESPDEAVESRIEELRDEIEAQRGPYAEDVCADLDDLRTKLTETRWTEAGTSETRDAVDDYLDAAGDALNTDFGTAEDESPEALAHELDAVEDAIEAADLDADADAETVAALVEATEGLETGLDAAEEWDDLQTNEQLLAEGFYDVLGHYKDYPVEWAALKEHEQQGNVDQILRALDALDSEFMERHCLEALTRMGDAEAFEEMHDRASRRDQPGVEALGKMGPDAEDAVETLVEYVDTDSDPQLQKVTFRALGEIGSEEATQALADKLEMDNDNVRPLAARALGMIGDTRAIEPLAETVAEDEDRNVRTAAAWALRQIGTREALEAAAEYDDAEAYTLQAEAKKAGDALDAAAVEA
ncbi:HEAT repeat domain-containing protein [Halolamina salifodinae]|uniref:Putative nucleic acid-binding Zn-ribbon protein n=1 Tax=Halolamina salifodinae TaxID=1202767 RepID=A0A8T4H0F1_9EURY|nr:HEAT repeat domain-containing protein [Halolamina salifodinae]MBP1987264.1 putative nucleic acid-binding Zn-ribbon protein [Halolamina salifodinae]